MGQVYDRAGWRKLSTEWPFDIGKPHVRPPRRNTRLLPADRRRVMAQRAAEVAQRCAFLMPRSPPTL